MVIFITDREVYNQLAVLISSGKHSVWLSQNVLSAAEVDELRDNGIDVSVFSWVVNPDDKEAMGCALETIKEHHPDQVVLAQY